MLLKTTPWTNHPYRTTVKYIFILCFSDPKVQYKIQLLIQTSR